MTTRGEMIMEQPSADTLKVILAGHWQLGGELPGADKVQQRLEDRPGVRNLVFDTREAGPLGQRALDLPDRFACILLPTKNQPQQRRTAPRGAETDRIGLGGTGKKDAARERGGCRFSLVWATKPSISSNPRPAARRREYADLNTGRAADLEPQDRATSFANHKWPDPLNRPLPIANFRHVLSDARDVLLMLDQLDMQALLSQRRHVLQPWHAVDHIAGQVVAVDLIHYGHIEWGGRCTFFLVSAHVQVGVIGASIGEPVDQPRIPVEGEDNGLVSGKKGIEVAVGEPVGMLARRLQRHQVHHIDDANLQIREVGDVAPTTCRIVGSTESCAASLVSS